MGEKGDMGDVWKALAFALLATTVAAYPVTEEHLLDDTNLIAMEDNHAASLQKQLAKLEHTFDRIKKSCVANNVPHELGETMSHHSEVVPKTVAQLKAAIMAKNAAIDK